MADVRTTVAREGGNAAFWRDRYETQHRKVHAMEDLISFYRQTIDLALDELMVGDHVTALAILSRATNQEDRGA